MYVFICVKIVREKQHKQSAFFLICVTSRYTYFQLQTQQVCENMENHNHTADVQCRMLYECQLSTAIWPMSNVKFHMAMSNVKCHMADVKYQMSYGHLKCEIPYCIWHLTFGITLASNVWHFLFDTKCSTSLPGGNQVDGLPPAPSPPLRFRSPYVPTCCEAFFEEFGCRTGKAGNRRKFTYL